ncbi:hypothetical protein C2I33_04250 [Ralstonia solanacearum]|uniref:hypothetical protein n=2 Tax=Ralstonia solanacearum TaxID=305 RepID=UPI000181657B|nr:hypothetical protein [Ralstonia solanacearum]TYZ56038.1 hypothetical protein C2I33_04250 [Ralstonia solanacearum]
MSAFAATVLPLAVASLDRRVKVLNGVPEDAPPVQRTSELRSYPYVVLVGEPGMGKSTVLAREAAAAQTQALTVRSFIHGATATLGATLYLDGLDEYRSDRAQAADKAEILATRLVERGAPGWWLTCRAEDWDETDRRALLRAAAGAGIVVARLEPLDESEVKQILASLAGAEGEAAIAQAGNLVGRAFLQNPLSLVLLLKAVQAEQGWPSSRFALFDSATRRLAHEHNQNRRSNAPRETPDAILAAAGRMCSLLLLANHGGWWHSNALPPAQVGAKGLLPTSGLGETPGLLADTLDTALFRREEEAVFVPMHRTVAEYLAGRALAEAVAGTAGRPRYPLSRALALIAGVDGLAPSELRGVFAWTAVHLSKLGQHVEATQMVRQDAVSVLIYGDAAALATPERRELLANLDRQDPWFRSAEEGDTAVSGLAGEDLASEFEAVLRAPAADSHLVMTVLEALQYGQPVPSLLPLLHEIVLAPSRPAWQRKRAAEAWVASATDRIAASLALYRAVSTLPSDKGNVALRLALAGQPLAVPLTDQELDQLLVDHYRMSERNTVGRLRALARQLQRSPRRAICNRAWGALLDQNPASGARIEIEQLLDENLVALLRASPAPTGAEVWQWLANRHRYPSQAPSAEVRAALHVWLDADAQHGLALFDAIVGSTVGDPPGWPTLVYHFKVSALPSLEVMAALLDADSVLSLHHGEERCLSMAVALASVNGVEAAYFWMVFDFLYARPMTDANEALVNELCLREIDTERQQEAQRKAAWRAEEGQDARALRAEFELRATDLETGVAVDLLDEAADIRFGHHVLCPRQQAGFEQLQSLVGEALAAAAATGWQRVAGQGLHITSEHVGEAEAGMCALVGERSILAGVDMILATRPTDAASLPLITALVVLRALWQADQDKPATERLTHWTLARLAAAGDQGRAALVALWSGALDAGLRIALPGMWLFRENAVAAGFASTAVSEILRARPDMPAQALESALDAAVCLVSSSDLLLLAQQALDHGQLGGNDDAWLCVALALDPEAFRTQFSSHFQAAPKRIEEHFARMCELAQTHTTNRVRFADTVFRVFAPAQPPGEAMSWSSSPANGCLAWLQESADPSARSVLVRLADEPALAPWRNSVLHAMAMQARSQLDRTFAPPSVLAIQRALSGGPPVNAADLRAVVVDQLRQIQAEMQVDSTMPWQAYWNEDAKTGPTDPKIENSCRNVLGYQLKARLAPFGISIPPLPEAQRAAETRVDVLILSGAGANLPIEAKRHYHAEVWTAASHQLQGYTADLGAGGLGVYVVFWFGSFAQTPSRGEGNPRPTSAHEMETMLRDDLPKPLAALTDIVVLDVSNPRAPAQVQPPRTVRAKPGTGKKTGQPGKKAPTKATGTNGGQ